MARSKSVPRYTCHKATGQARVRIDGKDHYLGKFGLPESHQAYAKLIADWQRRHEATPQKLTIGELALFYLEFAKGHYRKNGEITSEVGAIKSALRPLIRDHRNTLAHEFSPRGLKLVRESMVEAGHVRTSINSHVGRLRRMFRWAASEELLPIETYLALQTVTGLKTGRSDAIEANPVKPVPLPYVDAVLPLVAVPIAGMIRLQLLTGMRPGEVRTMRGCDLNTSGDAWEYTPAEHKTEHHGKSRVVMIGPNGQQVLRDYLKPDLQAFIFDPRDGIKNPGRRNSSYSRYSYRQAIAKACKRAGVPVWHPNQLRHNFATLARREFGIEGARVTLGHSSAVTSEIYAERDIDAARAVVARIG